MIKQLKKDLGPKKFEEIQSQFLANLTQVIQNKTIEERMKTFKDLAIRGHHDDPVLSLACLFLEDCGIETKGMTEEKKPSFFSENFSYVDTNNFNYIFKTASSSKEFMIEHKKIMQMINPSREINIDSIGALQIFQREVDTLLGTQRKLGTSFADSMKTLLNNNSHGENSLNIYKDDFNQKIYIVYTQDIDKTRHAFILDNNNNITKFNRHHFFFFQN